MLLPKPMKNMLVSALETRRLSHIPLIKADATVLPKSATISILELFSGTDLIAEWEVAKSEISKVFEYIDKDGAINPGDRQALYYLIRRFKPQSVLEIGTHLGGSTLHIAMALKACRHMEPPHFTTLDIHDVNDPSVQLWADYGISASVKDMLVRVDCADLTNFAVAPSLNYLAVCETKFDFIFLDGSHKAHIVYQEIPLALKALCPGGYLLLHDYFPKGKPLWKNGVVVPGPYLAVRRLQCEGVALTAVPLGELPWPTKLGSSVTSLALLVKS